MGVAIISMQPLFCQVAPCTEVTWDHCYHTPLVSQIVALKSKQEIVRMTSQISKNSQVVSHISQGTRVKYTFFSHYIIAVLRCLQLSTKLEKYLMYVCFRGEERHIRMKVMMLFYASVNGIFSPSPFVDWHANESLAKSQELTMNSESPSLIVKVGENGWTPPEMTATWPGSRAHARISTSFSACPFTYVSFVPRSNQCFSTLRPCFHTQYTARILR